MRGAIWPVVSCPMVNASRQLVCGACQATVTVRGAVSNCPNCGAVWNKPRTVPARIIDGARSEETNREKRKSGDKDQRPPGDALRMPGWYTWTTTCAVCKRSLNSGRDQCPHCGTGRESNGVEVGGVLAIIVAVALCGLLLVLAAIFPVTICGVPVVFIVVYIIMRARYI